MDDHSHHQAGARNGRVVLLVSHLLHCLSEPPEASVSFSEKWEQQWDFIPKSYEKINQHFKQCLAYNSTHQVLAIIIYCPRFTQEELILKGKPDRHNLEFIPPHVLERSNLQRDVPG